MFLENLFFDCPGRYAIESFGGKIVLSSCWIKNANYGLVAREGADIRWNCNANTYKTVFADGGYCKGYFAYAAYASQITYAGLIPRSGSGTSSAQGGSSITDVTGGGTTATVWKTATTETTVSTVDVSLTCSLKYYGTTKKWATGEGAYQGYSTGKGQCYGGIWFEMPSNCASVEKAT